MVFDVSTLRGSSWRKNSLAALACCIALGSCHDSTGPANNVINSARPDIKAWVAGDAASHLDRNGRFVFPSPDPLGDAPIISPARANELAVAYIKTYLWPTGPQSLGAQLESEHGLPVKWTHVGPRTELTYYAESAFEPFPSDIPLYVRRAFGPSYLMSLDENSVQVALLTVAAHSTDTGIDSTDQIVFPLIHGGEFTSSGIPSSASTWIPLSAEQAVWMIGARTGVRTISLPRLTRTGEHAAPYLAKWQLVLERRISLIVAATGEKKDSDTIYAGVGSGWTIEWALPSPIQPSEDTIPYAVSGTEHTFYAKFRRDVPVRFDRVHLAN